MKAIEALTSVLCDPEGKCCISGSDDDRRLIDSALAELAQAAQQAPAGVTLRSMIEGMSVSVDVSTGDHDAGHRYFGTVTEVMECQGDKHGVTLLVQDAEPNFTATPTAPSTPSSTAQQASAHVLHLVQDAFAEVAMAYPKAFALHKVGLADTAVRKALAAYTPQAADSVQEDAARYRLLRRGQHWSVIDGIGDDLLRAEALDESVDAVRKQ